MFSGGAIPRPFRFRVSLAFACPVGKYRLRLRGFASYIAGRTVAGSFGSGNRGFRELLSDRIATLISYLARGELVAIGTFVAYRY